MGDLGIPVPESHEVSSTAEAISIAGRTQYPVMIRSESSRDDTASGVAWNEEELKDRCAQALLCSAHIQIEQWLGGWKKLSSRFCATRWGTVSLRALWKTSTSGHSYGRINCRITMQTLSDGDMRILRDAAVKIADKLDVFGEASIRFALDPESSSFRAIEANTCVSRSTALASKAAGMQIGYIATRIMLGFSLSEIENKLTGSTKCCTEPSFDYIALKIPRWDLGKFRNVDRHIGAEMKSVGEAMAFGRTFEEALQKAVRMIDSGAPGIACHQYVFKDLKDALKNPTDLRIFAVYSALAEGWSIDRCASMRKSKAGSWGAFKTFSRLKLNFAR